MRSRCRGRPRRETRRSCAAGSPSTRCEARPSYSQTVWPRGSTRTSMRLSGPGPVDDRVLLRVDETGHGSRSDLVGLAVDDDLALPFDEVENLRVSMAVGRRLHARLHLREAHQHEVAVIRSHDLLVHDARPDPFLPRLRRQVAHDRSHDPLRRRRTLSCYKYPARVRSATRSRPGTRRGIGAPFPTGRGPQSSPTPRLRPLLLTKSLNIQLDIT